MSDVNLDSLGSGIEIDLFSEPLDLSSVSGGDFDNFEIFQLNTELLEKISDGVDYIQSSLIQDDILLLSSPLDASPSSIDGYFFTYGSETVYIPSDRVQYISLTSSGELINLSSSTITCMALNPDGSHGHTYRFQSFGTAQRYNLVGSYYQWDSISTAGSDTNIVFGQTGLQSISDVLLFVILVLLAFISFIRWRH